MHRLKLVGSVSAAQLEDRLSARRVLLQEGCEVVDLSKGGAQGKVQSERGTVGQWWGASDWLVAGALATRGAMRSMQQSR